MRRTNRKVYKSSRSPKYRRFSPVNIMTPEVNPYWNFWCKASKEEINTICSMYNTESTEDAIMQIDSPPNPIKHIISEQAVFTWHPLLIVFYSMIEPCQKRKCYLGGDCGFYHSKHAGRNNPYIKIEYFNDEYYVFYNTIGKNNIKSPLSYKTEVCKNELCYEDENLRRKCSFYHTDNEKFDITSYNFGDLLNAFNDTFINHQTEAVAWSMSKFLLE